MSQINYPQTLNINWPDKCRPSNLTKQQYARGLHNIAQARQNKYLRRIINQICRSLSIQSPWIPNNSPDQFTFNQELIKRLRLIQNKIKFHTCNTLSNPNSLVWQGQVKAENYESDVTQTIQPKVVSQVSHKELMEDKNVCKKRKKKFTEILLYLRDTHVKLTNKLFNQLKSELLLGDVKPKLIIDKILGDLKRKISLDNELTQQSRTQLAKTNPSVLVNKEDMKNAWSKDPQVKTMIESRLATQLKAIQECRATIVAEFQKGNFKLSEESAQMLRQDLEMFYSPNGSQLDQEDVLVDPPDYDLSAQYSD